MAITQVTIVNDAFAETAWMETRSFTDDARKVMRDTIERSRARGTVGIVEPMLLLWSLLRWERKIGVICLEACGVSLRSMEQRIEAELLRQQCLGSQLVIDFERITLVATIAVDESRDNGNAYVGTEHLMLALLKINDTRLNRCFAEFGVTYSDYKARLTQILGT